MNLKLIIRASLSLLIVFSTPTIVLADQPMILLRGKVTGPHSAGKVDLLFKEEGGSNIRSTSKEDGSYQTVVRSGKHYTVTITDQDLQHFMFNYDSPTSTTYKELNKDFDIQLVKVEAPVSVGKTKKKSKSKKTTKVSK